MTDLNKTSSEVLAETEQSIRQARELLEQGKALLATVPSVENYGKEQPDPELEAEHKQRLQAYIEQDQAYIMEAVKEYRNNINETTALSKRSRGLGRFV
jgi:hypothetical protein